MLVGLCGSSAQPGLGTQCERHGWSTLLPVIAKVTQSLCFSPPPGLPELTAAPSTGSSPLSSSLSAQVYKTFDSRTCPCPLTQAAHTLPTLPPCTLVLCHSSRCRYNKPAQGRLGVQGVVYTALPTRFLLPMPRIRPGLPTAVHPLLSRATSHHRSERVSEK